MIEIITGVTVLVLIIMVIRRLTKGMISMRLRYALWIMVVLRLMLPVNIGSSMFSVMNAQKAVASYVAENMHDVGNESAGITGDGQGMEMVEQENGYAADSTAGIDTSAGEQGAGIQPDVPENTGKAVAGVTEHTNNPAVAEIAGAGEARAEYGRHGRLFYVAIGIWIAGSAAVGGCMAAGQIRFIFCLRRTREEVSLPDLPKIWEERMTARGMHVYTVQGMPGPCMSGKNIYINPRLCDEKDSLLHVLAHEYAHAVQGDTLWAVVRCAFCAVYWFHPFVWLAAYEAKQDSELACDERAIGLLGETERFAYGRTLLDMVSDGHKGMSYAGALLMMNDSAKKMKERVSEIAGTRKKSGITAGIVALTVVLACGCAFTGAQQNDEAAAEEQGKQDEAAMRAEAETIEREEQEAIQKYLNEQETMERRKQQEIQTMRAAVEEIGQSELDADVKREYLEAIRQMEKEEEIIQKHFDEIRDEWRQATAEEFGKLLYSMGDDLLESAVPADSLERMDCYSYLYEGGTCPIEDGTWCRLYRDQGYGIEIYGFYTEKYGCRGIKMKIGDDVNTWDMLWRLPVFESEIDVMVLERTGEGLPRTFAMKVCTENTGTSEVWKLYIADRYDTGTVDLYAFDEEDCRKQFRDKVGFSLNEEENIVLVTYEGDDVVGTIDISDYAEYTVDEIIWDGSVMGYSSIDGNTISLSTCIGLKIAETGEVLYGGLPIINCPLDFGAWGERKFTLGTPSVDTNWVNRALK